MNTVKFGLYDTYNIDDNGKFLTIPRHREWSVLEKLNGEALLISKYVYETMCYDEVGESACWDLCGLRKWLNSEFYNNKFRQDEKNISLSL